MKRFLHQIGRLLRQKEPEPVPFKVLFADFKRTLELNNQILDLIADANDKLSGNYIYDEQYIQTTCHQLTDLVRELIVVINHLTRQKYADLFNSFHHIEGKINVILQGEVSCPVTEYILPYDSINRDLVDGVGCKNAHLAEIGSLLGLAIPEGFAVTTAAFSDFWQENNLEKTVFAIVAQWQDNTITVDEASRKIQKAITTARLPVKIEQALLDAAGQLVKKQHHPSYFAVRSSALGEDDFFSFAGQYRSCLNVSLEELPETYKEVVASLFSPEAMEYRLRKDFRPHEIMMAVACQLMIPAKASGVMYTYDPVRPETETLVINSIWGLGESIVAGKAPADHFIIERRPPHEIRETRIVRKQQCAVPQDANGITTAPLREYQRTAPSLQNHELQQLTEIGLQLEKYFKKPQDIEYALDRHEKIVILQSRPLRLQKARTPRACDLTSVSGKYPILMQGKGIAAMEGIAAGPVRVLEHSDDLQDFPMGGILVAKYASPQLARVIHKASGFITDVGSTTGHLATVAREFRVPALFNAENATSILQNGRDITLDTECLTVYDGIVQELHYYSLLQEEPIEEMYEYRLLRRVLRMIEPLNLFDPNKDNFTPQGCRTYHDLTRFIHEKAVETIIHLNFYHAHHRDTRAGRLQWDYPLDLVLIDIGGGIKGEHDQGIRPEQIRSVPMQVLLRGMAYPGIWDMRPMKVDFGSFMSSLTRTVPTRNSSPEDVGRNLAVISAEYTNINFRLGYHFTVIDAYISDNMLDNHIYFRFSGGVTDTIRRSRRTRLLDEILSHYDFLCELHGDIVVARLKRMDKESMLKRLFLLGLLVGFTRQLDVKMVSDAKVHDYFEQIITIMEESNE